MHKLVRYDLYRAFRQVSTYVLLAITLVFALISVLDATFFSGELGSDLVLTFGNTNYYYAMMADESTAACAA